jgi:hypothetical protein
MASPHNHGKDGAMVGLCAAANTVKGSRLQVRALLKTRVQYAHMQASGTCRHRCHYVAHDFKCSGTLVHNRAIRPAETEFFTLLRSPLLPRPTHTPSPSEPSPSIRHAHHADEPP